MTLPLLLEAPTAWRRTAKFNPAGAALADRHYSRRTVGSSQFMPPGQTVVLITNDERAVFGWWRPDPAAGFEALNGLDGWTCTIFRNEGPARSSDLIVAAERELVKHAEGCGPDGLITYVWCAKVRSANPGYCFQRAGWSKTGWSADRRKRLLQKTWACAGLAA